MCVSDSEIIHAVCRRIVEASTIEKIMPGGDDHSIVKIAGADTGLVPCLVDFMKRLSIEESRPAASSGVGGGGGGTLAGAAWQGVGGGGGGQLTLQYTPGVHPPTIVAQLQVIVQSPGSLRTRRGLVLLRSITGT